MANQDDHPSARLQAAKVKLLEDLLQQRMTHLHLHHKSDPKRNYYKYLLQKPWNPQLLVSKPPHHSFSFLFLFLFPIFQSSQVLTYLLRPPPPTLVAEPNWQQAMEIPVRLAYTKDCADFVRVSTITRDTY